MSDVDISIIVVTYNSKWKSLERTLESIIAQKGMRYEVIISDDGSTDNHYPEIKKYFREKEFENYVLVENEDNVGTIRNFIRALEYAKGEYVKEISPGDFLIGTNVLEEWINALKCSGKSWSFGDVVYVRNTTLNEIDIESHPLSPQNIMPYVTNDEDAIKYSYVVLDERVAGPATICKREMWLGYLQRLASIIKYAEDLSYTMMALEDEIPLYFRRNVVVYELGTGISTSGNSKWVDVMVNEKRLFDEYIRGMDEYAGVLQKSRGYWKNVKELPHKRMSSLYFETCELTSDMYVECCNKKWESIKRFSEGKDLWIYGAGFGGQIIAQLLLEQGISIEGFIDKNHKEIGNINGLAVIGIEELDTTNAFFIITLLEVSEAILNYIRSYGIEEKNYIYIPAIRRISEMELMDIFVTK